MKKSLIAACLIGMSVFAADYSAMTTTELQAMRGTVPAEDRAAYQAAVQERMRTMTQEEKQTFMQNRVSNPSTGSMGSNASNGMGSGMGGGGGHGRGGR